MRNLPNLAATLAAALLAIVVAGCAGPHRTPLRPEAAERIKHIALASVDAPKGVSVTTCQSNGAFATMGAIGGLIGGAFQALADSSATNRLSSALQGRQADLGERLAAAVEAGIQGNGFHVTRVDVARREPGAPIDDPKTVVTEADAVLDVTFRSVEYACLQPSISVATRLWDRGTGRILYADETFYANISGYADSPGIKPDPAFRFASVSALVESPDRALDGLRAGVDQIALRITERTRR